MIKKLIKRFTNPRYEGPIELIIGARVFMVDTGGIYHLNTDCPVIEISGEVVEV